MEYDYIHNYIKKTIKDQKLYDKIDKIIIPFGNSIQLKNWIIKNNKITNSLITLKILLRNKEFIYILCERDFTSISFDENNKEFINQNIENYSSLINCFKKYMKTIDYQLIEFGENLNSLSFEEKQPENDILKICDFCGFHVNKYYYSEHKQSNCEYSNIFICYICFKNYEINKFIKHKEHTCLREKHEGKILQLEENIRDIYSQLKYLKPQVDENTHKIGDLEKRVNYFESQLSSLRNELKNEINEMKRSIENTFNSRINGLDNKISSLESDVRNLRNRVNNNRY